MNLIPDEAQAMTPNYVCTWNIQDWVQWHEAKEGSALNKRDIVDDAHLFNAENGWVTTLYPEVRGDLIFLLDDGWDLPYGTVKGGTGSEWFGSQILPEEKFPEYGDTPEERLKTLNEKILQAGWRGTGLWICAQESAAAVALDGQTGENYWRERLMWSQYAGIAYWKIDWGEYQRNENWRRIISSLAEEICPDLVIEHIVGGSGTNNKSSGRIDTSTVSSSVRFASFSDVFRTYDVLDALSVPVTLERVGQILSAGYTEEGRALGLLNAEDELYMSAALGLSMGVMRFPVTLANDSAGSGDAYFGIGTEADMYFIGGQRFAATKSSRTRLDEVARAVRWQRIAPAYELGGYDVTLSDVYLEDNWNFLKNESWEGGTSGYVSQKAPAAIARGISLPEVTVTEGDAQPFVLASRNPTGAISIATLGRTSDSTGYQTSKHVDVSLNVGDLTGKIGVFGCYGSLTLDFNQSLEGKRIFAQDLLSDKAVEITDQVAVEGGTLVLSGALLEEIGLSAATKGDTSEPGLVLQIGEEADFVEAPTLKERYSDSDSLQSTDKTITLLPSDALRQGNAVKSENGGKADNTDAYIGWLGTNASGSGSASFTFKVDGSESSEWYLIVHYLQDGIDPGDGSKYNNRYYTLTLNGVECSKKVYNSVVTGDGGWQGAAESRLYLYANKVVYPETVLLKPGTNTLMLGNSETNAPTLYKVELKRLALSEDNPDEEAAAAVIEQIAALGEITSLDQEALVELARAAYDALSVTQQELVSNYAALLAAEEAILELREAAAVVPGDVDGDGFVTVSDVVALRQRIIAGTWSDAEYAAGNLDDSDKLLSVSDVVALRQRIVAGS